MAGTDSRHSCFLGYAFAHANSLRPAVMFGRDKMIRAATDAAGTFRSNVSNLHHRVTSRGLLAALANSRKPN
jgi:hypothetical protein